MLLARGVMTTGLGFALGAGAGRAAGQAGSLQHVSGDMSLCYAGQVTARLIRSTAEGAVPVRALMHSGNPGCFDADGARLDSVQTINILVGVTRRGCWRVRHPRPHVYTCLCSAWAVLTGAARARRHWRASRRTRSSRCPSRTTSRRRPTCRQSSLQSRPPRGERRPPARMRSRCLRAG